MASSMVRQTFGIGHRGARNIAKENTLDSFHKCIAMGIKMIEFDINITADNVLVVYHDTTMPDNRAINQMTLAEFQQYDHEFPTVEAMLTDPLIIQSDVKFYFDIKDERVVIPLLNYLKSLIINDPSLASRFYIASFTPSDVILAKEIRDNDPVLSAVRIGGLYEDEDGHNLVDNAAEVYSSYGFNFLSVENKLCSKDLVRSCHERGIIVFSWLTNAEEECERLLDMDIDGYCGDDMDLLIKYQLKSSLKSNSSKSP